MKRPNPNPKTQQTDDFSALVDLINGLPVTDGEIMIKNLRWRLMDYTTNVLGAPPDQAEDIVHSVMLITIENIARGKIKKPKAILQYMMTSCWRMWLKFPDNNHIHYDEEISQEDVAPDIFVSKTEQMRACIRRLSTRDEGLLSRLIDNNFNYMLTANQAGITYGALRVRISRIYSKIKHTYEALYGRPNLAN